MPWLRARGVTAKGNVILTSGAYHPTDLLYFVAFFGDNGSFKTLWTPGKIVPNLQWSKYFPEALLAHWKVILDWPIDKYFLPNREQDSAAAAIADFFAEHGQLLPFRPPTLLEKQEESELGGFYDDIHVAKPILTEEVYTSLIENFFKPSALKAAAGRGRTGSLRNFVRGKEAGLIFPEAVDPNFFVSRYQRLIEEVRAIGAKEHETGTPGSDPELFATFDKAIIKTPAEPLGTPLVQWISETNIRKLNLTSQPTIKAAKCIRSSDIPESFRRRKNRGDTGGNATTAAIIATLKSQRATQRTPFLTIHLLINDGLVPRILPYTCQQQVTASALAGLHQALGQGQQIWASCFLYDVENGISLLMQGPQGTQEGLQIVFIHNLQIYALDLRQGTKYSAEVVAELSSADHQKCSSGLSITRNLEQAELAMLSPHLHELSFLHIGSAVQPMQTTIIESRVQFTMQVNFWLATVLGLLFGARAWTLPYSQQYIQGLVAVAFAGNRQVPGTASDFASVFEQIVGLLHPLNLAVIFGEIRLSINFLPAHVAFDRNLFTKIASSQINHNWDHATICLPADDPSISAKLQKQIVVGQGWPTKEDLFAFGRTMPG